MKRRQVGLWMIGARGGVATTVAVGRAALEKGLTSHWGLVSEIAEFSGLDFVDWNSIVIGGHDIRQTSLTAESKRLQESSRILDDRIIQECHQELSEIDSRIRPGILNRVGPTIRGLADDQDLDENLNARQAVDKVQDDLKAFQESNSLDAVVVINLASTEPPIDESQLPRTWAELEPSLDDVDCPLPASSLYAIAALDLGFPFVNFTPSLGNRPEAIQDLALLRSTCHMGHDGKTGETLMKSALAPVFAARNLEVMSWVGHNIFGNMDGKVLDDPANKQTKVTSKDRLLREILGYSPQTLVSIEYIESLGDWKTAWDHVHFKGFLGTPMTLQFTWQGCDSLLAAPLVLDLFRFTELASRRGETGLLKWLASFFKSPISVSENNFVLQFEMLRDWAKQGVDA